MDSKRPTKNHSIYLSPFLCFCGSGPRTTFVATAGLGGTLLAHLLIIVYTIDADLSSVLGKKNP